MGEPKDVEHVVVGGGRDLVCHWPRQGGLWSWDQEVLCAYIESPCDYGDPQGVGHGQAGIWRHGYVRLRRSTDGGANWADAGIVFDNSQPVDAQRRALCLDDRDGPVGPDRESIDLASPDTVALMGRAWCGEEHALPDGGEAWENVTYCFRSPDRGRRWESMPSILWPNHTSTVVELANNVMSLGGARAVCWLVGCEGIEGVSPTRLYAPQLYASENHGATWDFYSEIARDPTGRIASSYPQVIVLPSGRWLCTLGCWYVAGGARIRWTSICHSDDEGLNWSQPRRIHVWSVSPYPVLLDDGRIVLSYMRRAPDPTGLYAIVSEDDGVSWSPPVCLRDDTIAAGPRGNVDGGYPVAVQMADGRVFVAYYWQHDDPDVPWYGGRKYIAGTFFRMG